jgi:hypothetical protein
MDAEDVRYAQQRRDAKRRKRLEKETKRAEKAEAEQIAYGR